MWANFHFANDHLQDGGAESPAGESGLQWRHSIGHQCILYFPLITKYPFYGLKPIYLPLIRSRYNQTQPAGEELSCFMTA